MIHRACRRPRWWEDENHSRARKVSSQPGIVGRKSAHGCRKSGGSQDPSCERTENIMRDTLPCCCDDRYLHRIQARSIVPWIDLLSRSIEWKIFSSRVRYSAFTVRCAKLPDEKLHVISILSRLSVRDALRFCATEQFRLLRLYHKNDHFLISLLRSKVAEK